MPGFVLGAAQVSVHLFCSAPLPGRGYPPYPADEVKEAHREGTCPITQLVCGRARIQTQLCPIPRHLCFSLKKEKEMGTAWGFSHLVRYHCLVSDPWVSPDTSSFPILGPALLCGGDRASVTLKSAQGALPTPSFRFSRSGVT